MYNKDIIMYGTGKTDFSIPSMYRFVTVLNNTGYNIKIYKGTVISNANLITEVPIYTYVTIPLGVQNNQEIPVTVVYTGTGESKATLVFSVENLGIQQTLVQAQGYSSVTISADNAGLAKADQIPALVSGKLPVFIDEPVETVELLPFGFNIVPSDTVNFTNTTRVVYVGTAGNISALLSGGQTVTFNNVPVGFHNLAIRRVNATGTTATGLVGLYRE